MICKFLKWDICRKGCNRTTCIKNNCSHLNKILSDLDPYFLPKVKQFSLPKIMPVGLCTVLCNDVFTIKNNSNNCRKQCAFINFILLACFSCNYKAGGDMFTKRCCLSPMDENGSALGSQPARKKKLETLQKHEQTFYNLQISWEPEDLPR